MQEGSILESSYYFPADEIKSYMEILDDTNYIDYEYMQNKFPRKLVIMTHDDKFDIQIYYTEKVCGYKSTWFLLSSEFSKDYPDIDVQLHFNKEDGLLSDQIKSYEDRFGYRPRYNRNHQLLWRSDNFDFPFLAMNGIEVDSSKIGLNPYYPVINGKKITILELPVCIADKPIGFNTLYNISRDNELLFKKGISPITVLAHPFDICREHNFESCFNDVIYLAQKYDYEVVGVNEIHRLLGE